MVTLEAIIHLLKRGDWFVVVDLKDAYFHIIIHQKYRKYLRLIFMDTIYQYVALPFGLSTQDLHQVHGPGGSFPPSTRDTDLPLYRRLVGSVQIQSKSNQEHTICSAHSTSTRPVDKL